MNDRPTNTATTGQNTGRASDRRINDHGPPSGVDRRRGPGRRLSDYARAAENGELTDEQFQFVRAIDAFKKANGVGFPSWTDILEVVRLLGYRKTMPSEVNMPGTEDWRERPDAAAGVRPDDWQTRPSSVQRSAAAPTPHEIEADIDADTLLRHDREMPPDDADIEITDAA